MRGREALGGQGRAGALLAVLVLSFCFLLSGAQSVTISVVPSKPIEGGNVTLTPGSISENILICRWYRAEETAANTILNYIPSSGTQRPADNYTGRETAGSGCSLHIRNLMGNDTGIYLVTILSVLSTVKGKENIVVSGIQRQRKKPTSDPIPSGPTTYENLRRPGQRTIGENLGSSSDPSSHTYESLQKRTLDVYEEVKYLK